jgi:release factor glutamine methyltransferase
MALQLPFWDITALDVSEEALIQARSNALRHKANVKFQTVDVLNWETYPIFENSRWDVIVSNPPYVTESERASMRENVLRFEPEIALFVDDENPLVFYETIARLARLSLNEGGFLFFEINEHFGNEVAALLESLGFIEVVIANDIFRKARMVRGIKPKV